MGSFHDFITHMDWIGMILFLMSGVSCLLCLTVHELAHGWVAYRLGDPTAKLNGRLTLNPVSHIDWFGLVLLLTVGVGWAKPVPVSMRNFRNPKRDMAWTALAGPMSNLIFAWVVLGVGSVVFHWMPQTTITPYILLFVAQLAMLNVGLALFNLIPIPPLDGSKILNVCLPDRVYLWVLQYERFFVGGVLLLAWFGVLSGPLSALIGWVMRGLCGATAFPFELILYYFF